MEYEFNVSQDKKSCDIYRKNKWLGKVSIDDSGEMRVDYADGIMWLPIGQVMARLGVE